MLTILTRALTTWRPDAGRILTPEEHQASLEARWKSGRWVNPAQLFKIWGGKGVKPGDPVPGIGPLPGLDELFRTQQGPRVIVP